MIEIRVKLPEVFDTTKSWSKLQDFIARTFMISEYQKVVPEIIYLNKLTGRLLRECNQDSKDDTKRLYGAEIIIDNTLVDGEIHCSTKFEHKDNGLWYSEAECKKLEELTNILLELKDYLVK